MRMQLIKVTLAQYDTLVLQHAFSRLKEGMRLILLRIHVHRVSQCRFYLRCCNLFLLELSKLLLELGGCRTFLSMRRGARFIPKPVVDLVGVNVFLLLRLAFNLIVIRII